MSTAELQTPTAKPGLPRQVPYIIGNEACERFSYYGMKAILFVFLSQLFVQHGASAALAPSKD